MTFQFSEVISTIALTLSVFVFGWTIYRDAIQKPKFRVKLSVSRLIGGNVDSSSDPFLSVEALNLGPLPNRVGLIYVQKNWFRRRILRDEYPLAVVTHDSNHLATNENTRKLNMVEAGDSANFAIPIIEGCFLGSDYVRLGVSDGYGRMHWCKRSELKRAKSDEFVQSKLRPSQTKAPHKS